LKGKKNEQTDIKEQEYISRDKTLQPEENNSKNTIVEIVPKVKKNDNKDQMTNKQRTVKEKKNISKTQDIISNTGSVTKDTQTSNQRVEHKDKDI
jgi:hypothetical protein